MRTFSTILFAFAFCLLWLPDAGAQEWTVYEANELPEEAEPAWIPSNGSSTIWAIEVDPDKAGNNLLALDGADASGMYKTADFDVATSEVTVVMKVKAKDLAADRLTDIDIHVNGFRDQLNIRSNGTLSLQRSGQSVDLSGSLDVTEWNIYRMTIDASSGTEGVVNIYLNEDPTPVLTATTTQATGDNYFRFGDGNSSPTYSAYVDFITWDVTGAYSPSDQSLPSELVVTPLGEWIIYNADVEPGAFDPEFEVTQQGGEFTNAIVDDPIRAGNKLLHMTTTDNDDGTNDNNQWRQPLGEATAVTVVFRAKGNDDTKPLLFDVDFDFNGSRSAVRILPDGDFSIAVGTADGTPDPLTVNTQEWNIYRYTRDDDGFALYVNEDPTPVLTGTNAAAGSNSFFRFGDGWGSAGGQGMTLDTYFDWVVWDASGAYSPEQTRLPNDLLNPPTGDWTVYEADVEPGAFDPEFEVTQQGGEFTNAIVDDEDKEGNKLLHMTTTDNDDGTNDNNQWRQPLGEATAVTVVFKAKGNDDTKPLLFDVDFDFNGFRSAVRILPDGNFSIAVGTADGTPDPLTVDTQDWNIYRYTRDNDGFALYVNEESTPVLTGTNAAAGSNSFFRFGDGWGSSGGQGMTLDTYFDWIVWDISGAYSPEQTRLPDHLTGAIVDDVEPTISTSGTLAALIQDLGFSDDNTVESYTVSGSNLEADITITPPVNFEVSLNETDWFANDSPLVLAHTDGTVEETTIFVRLNATEVGEFSAEISHISEGADEQLVAVSGTTVDLVPEISLTESLEEFVKNLSSPVSSQNYRVSGQNLKGSITVTAPDDFEISGDEENWGSEIVIDAEERIVTNRIVYVRLSATALGSYSGDISHTATDAEDVNLAVSGEVIPDPGITVTGELTAFSQGVGRPSEPQTYTIMGANLAGNIEISLPEGFEISFNGEVWLPSLSLAPIGGNVAEMTLYVRLNALAQGDSEGEIVHSSAGVDAVSLSVSGTTGPGLVTSLEEAAMRFNLWPNPSSDRIIFERGNASSRAQLTIHSLSGQIVSSNKFESGRSNLEIDINTLPQGVYLIEYVDDSRNEILKFIKE